MNSKQVIAIGARPLPAYIGGSTTTNAERGRHEQTRIHSGANATRLECREGLHRVLQSGHRESIRVSETPGSADCLARAAERASSAACAGSASEGLNGSRCSPAAHELIAVCRSISARMALISNKIRVNASGAGSQLHGSSIARSESMNTPWARPLPQFGQRLSAIGSSPVDWYAISAEQADALPHVWQKGESAMGGLCGGLGFAGFGQLGPDASPGFLAQHLPRDLPRGFRFNTARLGWVHVTAPSEALVQVLLMHTHLCGDLAAYFWSDLASHSSVFCRNASESSSVMTEAKC